MSTQGLFGTNGNYIHCALCQRTAKIIDISHRKITYIRNVLHEPCCNYFKDPASMISVDPQYNKFENRIETFNNWPRERKQTPFELTVAGFVFLETHYSVKCFCCCGGVDDWEQNDKPDEVHSVFFKVVDTNF
ncbi:MAG: hypothetical protein KAG53_04825 [Endozoicomonadaceae bacterium]|nr:hypothetical protein [Endozoicomonadaceae bacterium]